MGHPAYQITSGTIHYKGKNIEDMEVFERARAGMFLSFQYPAAIPGVQVGTFLRKSVASVRGEAPSPRAFRQELNEAMKQLDMDKSFLSRYVNDGLAVERKSVSKFFRCCSCNLIWHSSMKPILDWNDALRIVAEGINAVAKDTGCLIITHYQRLWIWSSLMLFTFSSTEKLLKAAVLNLRSNWKRKDTIGWMPLLR